MRLNFLLRYLLASLAFTILASAGPVGAADHPSELLRLAEDIRAWRAEPEEVPDYCALAARQIKELEEFRARLAKLDSVRGWSVHAQADYLLLRSQLDREEYRLRVLRPCSRSPVFYTRKAIANVRPLLVGGRRLRPGIVPYSKERARAILKALAETDGIVKQAPRNLTEAVPELADMAMRHPGGGYLEDFDKSRGLKDIRRHYADFAKTLAPYFPEPEASQLASAAARAADTLYEFGEWIEQNRAKMTGSYVLGKDAYTWYLRRVLLLPHDADELLTMAAMERGRALAFFQFEQHKNRYLPPIQPAVTPETYLPLDDETGLLVRRFYKDLLTEPDNLLFPIRSTFTVRVSEITTPPPKDGRPVTVFLPPFGEVYFPTRQEDAQGGTPGQPVDRILLTPADNWRVKYSNMGFRTDPAVLYMHEYFPGHNLERQFHPRNSCPIRAAHRCPVHSQGWCFYNEEMPLMLDFPYVAGPRAREQVYINIYQRALRILQGVPLLNGDTTVEEALEFLRKGLPPGLGPSLGARPEEAWEETYPIIQRGRIDTCMIGIAQIYRLLADRRMQLGDKFDLRAFHDQFLAIGSIPIALGRWEMTGFDDEMDKIWNAEKLPVPVTPKPRRR